MENVDQNNSLKSKNGIDISTLKWVDKISDIREQATDRYKQLKTEMSDSNALLCDVEHEIELMSSMNASAGYKKYKELKSVLENRRKIKDKMEILRVINGKSTKNIIDEYNCMDNRVYKYRAKKEVQNGN